MGITMTAVFVALCVVFFIAFGCYEFYKIKREMEKIKRERAKKRRDCPWMECCNSTR